MYYEPCSQSPVPLQFSVLSPGYQSGCNTPLSVGHMQPMSDIGLLSQPGLSRPPTTYLDMPIPLTQEMNLTSGTPSDAGLKRTVQDILRTADLNTVMKCKIHHQLKEHFSMDLIARKTTINAAIDCTLLVQSWYGHAFIYLDSIQWTRHYGCTLVCGPNCLSSILMTLAHRTFVNSLHIMTTDLHIFIINLRFLRTTSGIPLHSRQDNHKYISSDSNRHSSSCLDIMSGCLTVQTPMLRNGLFIYIWCGLDLKLWVLVFHISRFAAVLHYCPTLISYGGKSIMSSSRLPFSYRMLVFSDSVSFRWPI